MTTKDAAGEDEREAKWLACPNCDGYCGPYCVSGEHRCGHCGCTWNQSARQARARPTGEQPDMSEYEQWRKEKATYLEGSGEQPGVDREQTSPFDRAGSKPGLLARADAWLSVHVPDSWTIGHQAAGSTLIRDLATALRAPVAAQPDEQTLTVGRDGLQHDAASRVRPRALGAADEEAALLGRLRERLQFEQSRAETIERLTIVGKLEAILGAADGWQPIETAPRDGDRVLAWPCYGMVREVCWERGIHPRWRAVGSGPDAVGMEPTHWRPLPPPPDKGAV